VRLALVVHRLPPTSVGGTEIYTVNLARELSRQGHETFVFYRDDCVDGGEADTGWESRQGFSARRVSRSLDVASAPALTQFLDTFYNARVEQEFLRFLEMVDPDVVHFQHMMSLSYRLIRLAKHRGLPSLLTLHDYWFICANSQLIWPNGQICSGKAMGLNCARCVLAARLPSRLTQVLRPVAAPLLQIRDGLVRRAALEADLLIGPSRFLIQQYTEAGFPADRFLYLENGIDVERIRESPRQSASDGKLRFTYLGSLAWQKGVHILVEAFEAIPARQAVLRIYGDPTVFPAYAARLKEAANPANTRFEGSIPNEEVGRVLATTDVMVVPSLWYENSPVVIQEALAAGVPIIASSIGALVEKVDDERWLFPPGDVRRLRRVIERSIAEGGVNHRGLSWPKSIRESAEQLARLYASLPHSRQPDEESGQEFGSFDKPGTRE